MQFEEAQPVLLAQRPQREIRRPWVSDQAAVGVDPAHQVDVVGKRLRKIVAPPQAADAVLVLGELLRIAGVERIKPGTGMGVDIPERLVLLRKITRQLDQHQMFENVGVITGVKGVTITEHGRRLSAI